MRKLVCVCMVGLIGALPGCTFIGGGVGAGIDSLIPGPYENLPRTETVPLRRGERVRLVLVNGARVEGRYVGTEGPSATSPETRLRVKTSDGLARVRQSEVRTFGIEVTGNGWLYGGLVGLALDVAVIVAISSMDFTPDYGGSLGSCWC
ncbi:MAG TPA: hypothetical protein VL137_18355 [Polyangiaceae bacterium]|nr:hypothetical protein [Polyangiaceae bacterium]